MVKLDSNQPETLPVTKSISSSIKSSIIFLLKFIWRFFPRSYNLAKLAKLCRRNCRHLSLIQTYTRGKGIWWRCLTKVGGAVIWKFESIPQFGGFRSKCSKVGIARLSYNWCHSRAYLWKSYTWSESLCIQGINPTLEFLVDCNNSGLSLRRSFYFTVT